MVKKQKSKIGEAGSLMIEALAMLGLISMVTPIIYKKAAERNSEIQDINSAAQIRNIIRAADDYTRENHTKITLGNTIVADANCPGSVAINFSQMAGAGEKHQEIPIANLCAYLPYGFLSNSGGIADDRIFGKNYKLIIKKADGGANGQKVLTNFLVASPKQGKEFAKIRTSRIASMIGSNGGFIDRDGTAKGVQGMWSIADPQAALGISIGDTAGKVPEGSIISSSVQPISTGGGADHLLHRQIVTGRPELNRMYTAIDMNSNDLNNINQAVILGSHLGGTNKDKALLLNDKAGAYITGVLGAAEMTDGTLGFLIDSNANLSTRGTLSALDGQFVVDSSNLAYKNSGNTDVFSVSQSGDMNLAQNATIGGDTNIKGNLTVDKTATIGDGNKSIDQLVVKGSAHIQGNLKVDDKFSALAIDTGILRAGTAIPHSLLDSDYTMKVDTTALRIKDSAGADKFIADRLGNVSVTKSGDNIFNVDQASAYTTVNGLKAGTSETTPALQVVNSGAGADDVVMNLVGSGNQIVAYDDKDKIALSVTTDMSTLQKVNAGNNTIYANFEARDTSAKTTARNTAGESFIDVRAEDITMDVDPTGSGVNFGLYKPGTKGTRAEMWLQNDTDLKVIAGSADPIFHVDTDINSANYVKDNAGKGSVYVRRGVIEIASGVVGRNNTVNPYKTAGDTNMGHIQADTFISNQTLDAAKLRPSVDPKEGVVDFSQGTNRYDAYMVNPAYTSVMHDIKLTTRGGARLSDILPDFINKGIYVVDNTYVESKNMNLSTQFSLPSASSGEPTSPWVGLVPAPQCPPGYQKVITIVPSTISMAQAGYVIDVGRGSKHSDDDFEFPTDSYAQIVVPTNLQAANPGAPEAVPLSFQRSTHLKTLNYFVGTGANFKGWNILMGFIYPKGTSSNKIFEGTKYANKYSSTVFENNIGATGSTVNVYWNLYPTFAQDLEAFANTYCYFARSRWANDYVDQYNQLDSFQGVHLKGQNSPGFNTRLNDPNLKYDEVW